MTEQARLITEEEWAEYQKLKEETKLLVSLLLKTKPELEEWLEKNFKEYKQ